MHTCKLLHEKFEKFRTTYNDLKVARDPGPRATDRARTAAAQAAAVMGNMRHDLVANGRTALDVQRKALSDACGKEALVAFHAR